MPVSDLIRSNWRLFTIVVTVVAIACVVALVLRNMPPFTIRMATGPKGSAYYGFGERYRAELARAGVEVKLVPTAGSPENLALLSDPRSGVSVGLIRGGTVGASVSRELESLGTVAYQPLWLFHKREFQLGDGFIGLRGRKISIGPSGSGTRTLSLELLKHNDIDEQVSELLTLSPETAGEKLLTGEIDVMLTLNSWEAPIVQKLLGDERIEVSSFPRADAYVALYPFLNKVVVPKGVGNLAKDLPPTDVILLAPKTSLIVRKDLHSAIQYLLLNAAVLIHSGPGIFQHAGQFPAVEAIDVPLSREARQFYKSGPPFLHNYLPFWMVELVEKLVLLLIPVLAVLYPVIRFLPSIYDWLMRLKIFRLYGELRSLDDEIAHADGNERETVAMVARLDQLEAQADSLKLPVAYASMLYVLRNHIDLVRARLRKRSDEAKE
jgi:TRAP-type uncharacterized transport system substrate-binding protein